MIEITSKGNYRSTRDFLNKLLRGEFFSDLDKYGRAGVDALRKATPVDTGLTAESWEYRIVKDSKGVGVEWYNTNVVNGTPVAVLIQYGHATRNGGYIQGRDFINPAIRPIFEKMANDIWKKVKA